MNTLRGTITIFALASLVLAGAASAQKASDVFVGTFAGEKSRLELRRTMGRKYEGKMTVGKTTLAVQAMRRSDGTAVTGHLLRGEQRYAFEARPAKGGLAVESGGKTRFLARVEAKPGGAGRIVLRPVQIRDRVLENVVSHTMVLPEGYTVQGGVVWTPGAMAFQTMNMLVQNGRGTEMRMLPRMTFRYEPPNQLAMRGLQVGSVAEFGEVIHPAPEREFGEFTSVIFPSIRPAATKLRILKQERLPASERFLLENTSLGDAPVPGTRRELRAVRTLVRYEEGGREYEEQIRHTFLAAYGSVGVGFDQSPIVHWMVDGLVASRVPVKELEVRSAELSILSSSFRATPQWFACQDQLQRQMSRIRHNINMDRIAAFGRISRQVYEANRELSDSQMASWRKRQESSDRLQRRGVDAIWEVERFKRRDGLDLSVGHRFAQVFEASDGSLVAVEGETWTPMDDPAFSQKDWKRLGKVDG